MVAVWRDGPVSSPRWWLASEGVEIVRSGTGATAVVVMVLSALLAGTACRNGASSESTATACAELGPALRAGTKGSGATDAAMFERVLAQAPGDIEEDLRYLADMAKKVQDDPGAFDKAEAPKVTETIGRVLEWTVSHCPSQGPYWNCVSQASISAVAGDKPVTVSGKATPEAALEAVQPGAKLTELTRTDSMVEYATVNDSGRVTVVRQFRKQPSGWMPSASRGCK
jgi:hypothetical protein